MGKLGKKARKFAKKNLQSVLKRKRKLKSVFKKKASSRDEQDVAEEQGIDTKGLSNGRNHEGEDIEDISLDAIFSEDDSDAAGDASESDGYLSEDSSCTDVSGSQSKNYVTDNNGDSALLEQNRKILVEIAKKTKKVDRLKEKDPGFAKFLESHDKSLDSFRNEDTDSDEDRTSNDGMQLVNGDSSKLNKGKLYTSSVINSWHQLVTEQHSVPALTCLLNGYRAACHHGNESTSIIDADACGRIQNSETFCKLLMFMLHEADNIFRTLLGIPCFSCRKEAILELKNTSIWKSLKPLIKSYLRSTLFLMNQVTDSEILAFILNRLRASILFFAAFPSLLRRLIKVAVHLWATGGGTLSSHSFLIIRDVASVFSSDCFDTCLIQTYKAFIGYCKFVEPVLFIHTEFLRNSFAELCSLDMQKSLTRAMVSVQQLSKILLLGLQTKEEALKKICSWQYTNCIDLWVTFVSANTRDFDLQPLLFMIIQIINGVVQLFPGPRYFPLRLKCIQWLNHLSSSSGVFIPVASLALEVLEYKIGKEGGKSGKSFNFSSSVKLPKCWLKSQNFQEGCVLSAVELLSVHFAQWSYHISFPELATIPLIRLKRFLEITTIESSQRVVKRFIDQVELNVEFVRKKRDEVSFSPKDEQSVATFLQLEKCSSNTSFRQYYKSIMEKAASRTLIMNEKISSVEQKKYRRKRAHLPTDMAENKGAKLYLQSGEENKGKKRKL